MTPIDDPSHDEDLFAFDFAEAVNVVGRALWSLTDPKGVNPDPRWPTLKDDLLALTHSLRACDGAPVVFPLHRNGKPAIEGANRRKPYSSEINCLLERQRERWPIWGTSPVAR